MSGTIKNLDELATTTKRRLLLKIAEAGYAAADVRPAIKHALDYNKSGQTLRVENKTYNLEKYKRIICIGFGKAALSSAEAVYDILGEKIACGFILDVREGQIGNLTCRIGSHPYPTMVNVAATGELLEMLKNLSEEDLVIMLISGGGSSLLCMPSESTCENESLIMRALTRAGATIQELNTVRKHISKVKGGQLAKWCYPASIISLITSDVPGNDMGMIASGPTVHDTSTMHDASEILYRHNILQTCQLPSCNLVETPKEKKYFEKVQNCLIVSPEIVANQLLAKADDLGLTAQIYSAQYQDEVSALSKKISQFPTTAQCLIGVGESTVKITGKGKGGRNQELALRMLKELPPDAVFAAFASDGWDNTEHAGALVDKNTLAKIKNPAIITHYLDQNDSYNFFRATGDAVITGITGTNVADFFIYLK